MAYDEALAHRIAVILEKKNELFEEKKMMGGLCFMVEGKMCIGIIKESLMGRVGPEMYEKCLKKKGCKEMDFTGRPMKGFVYVDPEAIETEKELDWWIQVCLDYNPIAKSTKKKQNTEA